ncbi:MAG: hypothetical protein ABFR90_01335 [Planctomycetota bacterium]
MDTCKSRLGLKENAVQSTSNIFYRVLSFVVLLLFFLGGAICIAEDIRADTLKQLEQSIHKIEDIQCTINVVQSGSYNPKLFKYGIDNIKTREKLGLISKEAAKEKIASKTRELENNKDFTFEHPPSKWKMKKSEGLYNVLINDGKQPSVLNYDGIRKIKYNADLQRGEINSQIKIPPANPYCVLSIDNMSIIEFYKLALENDHLTVSRKDNLIEISGMVLDRKSTSPGLPPNYLKVLIDPDKGYLPVYCEAGLNYGDDSLIKYTINDIQLEELDDNIWFPISANFINYDFVNVPDINIPAEEWKLTSFPSHFKINIALSQIKINQGLDQQDFTFDFPPSATVVDSPAR